jgi:hypothetical protein
MRMPLLSALAILAYEQAISLYFTREKGELIGADCSFVDVATANYTLP